jgi:hypothetical protein
LAQRGVGRVVKTSVRSIDVERGKKRRKNFVLNVEKSSKTFQDVKKHLKMSKNI